MLKLIGDDFEKRSAPEDKTYEELLQWLKSNTKIF